MKVAKREKHLLFGPKVIFECLISSITVIITAIVNSEYLRKLQEEKLHNSHSQPTIITVIKSKETRWDTWNPQENTLVGKSKRRQYLGIWRRYEDKGNGS
jgi:hypothetical protein